MGFGDLLLFYLVTGFTVRWIATAAAAGPSAIVIWLFACLAFYVPLMFTVLELSSRYPNEGGCYVWSKRAFGDFAGFITGWTYWACNLPYFPGLFYFTAATALFIGGPEWRELGDSPAYFIGFSLLALLLAAGLNIRGLAVGKWLHNLGAVGIWLPGLLLIGLGVLAWIRFGSATEFTAENLVPSTRLKDIVFWSTLAMLVAVPHSDILHLQGFMTAIETVCGRLSLGGLVPVIALLVVLGGLGQAGAWFAAAGRLPFVAGIDRFLPAFFGRIHPRFGSPYISLLVQAIVAAVFILLGQAGTTVKGAYDVLVSMAIISYFIPYLFMFASMIRLQREPAGPHVIRVPGGRPAATSLALLGFAVTSVAIVLALIPAADEPNKPLAVAKVAGLTLMLVGIGTLVYIHGARRRNG
jgi:glutamate:GABA antiporter